MKGWEEFVAQHPHEFTIQYPPRREYFKENFQAFPVADPFDGHQSLLLYLHVPFCHAKCYYCNFAVDVRNKASVFQAYTAAVCQELAQYHRLLGQGVVFTGIDIGGGTPTHLPLHHMLEILTALAPFARTATHAFPMSIETTPSIAADNFAMLEALVAGGVGRVSMGIQSFNIEKLEAVNRKLQIQKNEVAVDNIRKAGFARFNADLIFGLPGQSYNDWAYDLSRIIDLSPDSITTYDCLYRGKGRALTRKTREIPSLEHYGHMYDQAYDTLCSAGYYADYGSVNFSRIKGETGTSAYFEGRLLAGMPYIGVGNYASSQVGDYWFFNTYKVDEYINSAKNGFSTIGDFYLLPKDELYTKYILYSLNYGIINLANFQQRFGVCFESVFKEELAYASSKGWLYQNEGQWGMPLGSFKHMNYLRSIFYSSKAKAWLQGLLKDKKHAIGY